MAYTILQQLGIPRCTNIYTEDKESAGDYDLRYS